MDSQVLVQLFWIKWLLAAAVLVLLGRTMAEIWVAWHARKSARLSKSSRVENLRRLLEEGQFQRAVELAEEHLKSHPKDPHTFWALGKAYYASGELRRALVALRKAEELAPEWNRSYTGPMIEAIEERLSTGENSQGLKILSANAKDSTADADDISPPN